MIFIYVLFKVLFIVLIGIQCCISFTGCYRKWEYQAGPNVQVRFESGYCQGKVRLTTYSEPNHSKATFQINFKNIAWHKLVDKMSLRISLVFHVMLIIVLCLNFSFNLVVSYLFLFVSFYGYFKFFVFVYLTGIRFYT